MGTGAWTIRLTRPVSALLLLDDAELNVSVQVPVFTWSVAVDKEGDRLRILA